MLRELPDDKRKEIGELLIQTEALDHFLQKKFVTFVNDGPNAETLFWIRCRVSSHSPQNIVRKGSGSRCQGNRYGHTPSW